MYGTVRVSFVVAGLSILAFSASSVRAARCGPCEVVHQRCTANCFGLEKAEIGGCLLACNNEAAVCSCDEAVTLRSEDFVARLGSPRVTKSASACNSTTPCGANYGSCSNWSSWSDCGEPYCLELVDGCGPCGPEDPCIGPATQVDLERYRVCYNAMAQPCTEYERTASFWCGC